MTKTMIETIRAEIERLKGRLIRGACSAQVSFETSCKDEAYDEVLSFLDALESEKPMDQGEERLDFQEFAKEMVDILAVYKSPSNPEEEQLDYEWTIARHFAKWGAEHAKKEEEL